MQWISQNWFWVLIALVFVGVHLFGHGGHGGCGGGHAGSRPSEDKAGSNRRPGHQH